MKRASTGRGRSLVILASGTRGDLQPFLALGSVLADRGHGVTIAGPPGFRQAVEAAGLRHAALPGNPSDLLVDLYAERESSSSPAAGVRAVVTWLRRARACYRDTAAKAYEVLGGADAALLALPTFWLYPAAVARRIPVACCPLQPLTPTAAFASPLLSGGFPLPAFLNRTSHLAVERATWLPWRGTLRAWARSEAPGAVPSLAGPLHDMRRDGVPFLYGFSPHVVPRPADWPSNHLVTGYWVDRTSSSVVLPSPVPAFVRGGPASARGASGRRRPLVYIGFGSLAYLYREATEAARAAIARLGMRAIIQAAVSTAGGTPGSAIPAGPDVLELSGSLPHEALFPLVDGVVFHGGAGTFATAARAGTPVLVVPSGADTGFWASRAVATGIAPAIVSRRHASAEALTEAIATLVRPGPVREAAAALAAALRRERGAEKAAQLIERLLFERRA